MKAMILATALLVALFAPASAGDIGVVFMHGKWGTSGPKSPIAPALNAMQDAGYIVEAPEMPWSRNRAYEKDVEGALVEIDDAVKRLKHRGAKRIVVGGQSIGANVAIAYGVHREGLAGIMAVAPGHTPENSRFRSFEPDYQRAIRMIAAGTGDMKDSFEDQNQGKLKRVTATARAYVSWMDPKGMAVMPLNAGKLSPSVPFLWVIGQDDGLLKQGTDYAYSKVPANAKNAYKVVSGGHIDTPRLAATEIVTWLKSLD